MDKKKIIIIILIIAVYAISSGISYALFNNNLQPVIGGISPVPQETEDGQPEDTDRLSFDPALSKTEPCPINGALYSKQQKDWWEKHRPLGIMIENHENSRPQSGLTYADVIYEIVAEGGITRFLAVYHCQDAGQIGPVRSARTYFLDFVSEYGQYPLYAHVGGANTPGPADALSQIESYGWAGFNDLNQFSIGFPTFWRDYDRLGHSTETEHTMYSTTTKLWEFAKEKRKVTNKDEEGGAWDTDFISYTFKDDFKEGQRTESQEITVSFWDGYKQYNVVWSYDLKNNNYIRNHAGSPHIDRNNNKALAAKNIAVLFMRESNANDGYENNAHLLYGTKGTGKAQFFMDGKHLNGTWRKDRRTSRTLLFDNNGSPIKFNRGKIWFEILPTDATVVVK